MSESPTDNNRPVAFFDFDGTLTTGDTLMPYLKFVVGTPTYYAKLALVSPVLAAYFAKLLRNDIAKKIVLKQYLAGYHLDELIALGARFNDEVLPFMLRPEGMEKLSWHQNKGHECVLVSASLDIYLKGWASNNGLNDLICSALSDEQGKVVCGSLEGSNCYGEEKLRRVVEWLKGRGGVETFAYGNDAMGDLPLLKYADKGYIWNSRLKRFVLI